VRLFVAIPLPEDLVQRAAALLPRGLSGLRPIKPENLHVTLAFLGYTPDERERDAASVVREAALTVPRFHLSFDRAGRFPERGRPRVVWLGLGEGADSVRRLGEAVAEGLRRQALRFDDRPFSPHLTLARVREEATKKEVGAIAAAVAALAPPRLAADIAEILLMRSVLSRQGPTYTPTEHAPLGAPAISER
jgi:RNA 2',3'-cyclic 3'-phosphodiesterase